jgi:hypothetical protein
LAGFDERREVMSRYIVEKARSNDMYEDLTEYVEELEAKLAWAVGELEEMLMLQNSEAAYGILRVYTKALLAELKG